MLLTQSQYGQNTVIVTALILKMWRLKGTDLKIRTLAWLCGTNGWPLTMVTPVAQKLQTPALNFRTNSPITNILCATIMVVVCQKNTKFLTKQTKMNSSKLKITEQFRTIKPLATTFHTSGMSLESFKTEAWPDLQSYEYSNYIITNSASKVGKGFWNESSAWGVIQLQSAERITHTWPTKEPLTVVLGTGAKQKQQTGGQPKHCTRACESMQRNTTPTCWIPGWFMKW